MDEMSIAPDALRRDAAWIRRFAEETVDIDWPAVDLARSEVAAAVGRAPGLGCLATGLRAWADAAETAADALEAADARAVAGLAPR